MGELTGVHLRGKREKRGRGEIAYDSLGRKEGRTENSRPALIRAC